MFIKFNEEAQKILKRSKYEMQRLKHAYIGSEHLVLSILNSKTNLRKKLNDSGLTYDKFKEELIKLVGMGNEVNPYILYTPLLKRILINAIIDTRDSNYQEITLETIFLSLLDEGEGIAIRIMNRFDINIDDMYLEINSKSTSKTRDKKKNLIYEYGIELNKLVKENKIDPVIGREVETNKIIEILSRRTKNNPLLIGEAGVGKTAIVEELARRIENQMVPDNLLHTKIVSLSMSSLVAGTKYRGEFEERINKLVKEVENSEIILFIDEIHTLVGAGGAEGAIDASNILKPAMARGNIRIIGATTIEEYKDTITKDKALNRRFQTVLIEEPDGESTINILINIKNIYEKHHHVRISNNVIKELVYLSNKYIHNRYNPDKSIDILDEVCVRCSLLKNSSQLKMQNIKEQLKNITDKKNSLIITRQFDEAYDLKKKEMRLENRLNCMLYNLHEKDMYYDITVNDVAMVIRNKSNVPIYEVLHDDLDCLKHIGDNLKKIVIGQDNVIDDLIKITKRIKLGFKDNMLPTSILFQGSTGVGKTFLVKEYCKQLNMPLIRLDMSEYRESHSISKIIGSPPGYVGYSDNKNVLEKVVDNPYCVILLDEIEKSSNEVLNLFLQVLDEGFINDSKGNKINLQNTIIIMTSNIGCHKNKIGFNDSNKNFQSLVDELSLEFVNRIEKIIVFNKLTKDSIKKIIDNRIKVIKAKYQKYKVNLRINKDVVEKLIDDANYEINGARKVNKLIEEVIDNIVIDSIIEGRDKITINKDNYLCLE